MQADRDQDAEDEENDAQKGEECAHACVVSCTPVSSRARERAQASAASTSSMDGSWYEGTSCSATTRATVPTIPRTGSRPSRNARTHTSVAALNSAGAVPPR